jgi:hypothetical protein
MFAQDGAIEGKPCFAIGYAVPEAYRNQGRAREIVAGCSVHLINIGIKILVEASGFQLYCSSQKEPLERLERVCGIGHSLSGTLALKEVQYPNRRRETPRIGFR